MHRLGSIEAGDGKGGGEDLNMYTNTTALVELRIRHI